MTKSSAAFKCLLTLVFIFLEPAAADLNTTGYKLLKKVFEQCDHSGDVVKCLKVQALKLVDRALHSTSFKVLDGVYIIRDETARSFSSSSSTSSPIFQISDDHLQSLTTNQINGLLSKTTDKFLETHKVKLDVPKLVEEGRGRLRRHLGPLLALLALKGGVMALAMKGIALMAGTALMLGKMALLMSSIIGLKKLIGGGGKEKTTVEIVKHPQFSYGQSYSTSYEDAGHYGSSGGGGGGHGGGYHRSFEDNHVQEKPYSAHVPNRRR